MTATLPVSISAGDDFLSDLNGEAVWPVASAQDARALHALCQLRGARAVEVPLNARRSEPLCSDVVTSLDERDSNLAELYAHLTSREHLSTRPFSDLVGHKRLAVLIVRPEHLTETLLEALFCNPVQERVPGLILATSPQETRQQILVRSAAVKLEPLGGHILEYWPVADDGPNIDRDLISRPRASSVRSLLGSRSDLLSIAAHSDGIDAYLGSGLVLCPMPRISDDRTPRCPRCLDSGRCHRIGFNDEHHRGGVYLKAAELLPAPEAILDPRKVSIEDIWCNVLLLSVCWGVMNPHSAIDQSYSLGNQLINSSRIGALVTTWELEFTNFPLLRLIRRWLEDGYTVGQSVALANRDPTGRAWANRYCLFGDPDLRIKKRTIAADLRTLIGYEDMSPKDGYNFLGEYFYRVQEAVTGDLREIAAKAFGLIKSHGSRWNTVDDNTCRQVFDFFSRYEGTILSTWSSFYVVNGVDATKRGHCKCGCQTTLVTATSKFAQRETREVERCPACGIIKDAPAGFNTGVSVTSEGIVTLVGDRLDSRFKVALLIDPVLTTERQFYAWPTTTDGSISDSFSLPAELPIGPLYFAIICLNEFNISIACCSFRSSVDA